MKKIISFLAFLKDLEIYLSSNKVISTTDLKQSLREALKGNIRHIVLDLLKELTLKQLLDIFEELKYDDRKVQKILKILSNKKTLHNINIVIKNLTKENK